MAADTVVMVAAVTAGVVTEVDTAADMVADMVNMAEVMAVGIVVAIVVVMGVVMEAVTVVRMAAGHIVEVTVAVAARMVAKEWEAVHMVVAPMADMGHTVAADHMVEVLTQAAKELTAAAVLFLDFFVFVLFMFHISYWFLIRMVAVEDVFQGPLPGVFRSISYKKVKFTLLLIAELPSVRYSSVEKHLRMALVLTLDLSKIYTV